jgi:hypothetical protein
MEEANRILNSIEDDSYSLHGNIAGGSLSPPRTGSASAISDTIQRKRSLSVASALSISRKSDSLMPIYSTTAQAREAALPARVLGGGADTLSFWRFGVLSDDNRHHLAYHRHIFDTSQNISTSFDPKSFICTVCPVPHAVLVGAGGGGGDGAEMLRPL